MSSRKKLKKDINEAMDLLYADCLFYKMFVVDANQEAADTLMIKITEIHDDLLKRVNVNEGKDVKGRVKTYYKKLREDIKEKADAIAQDIASLG